MRNFVKIVVVLSYSFFYGQTCFATALITLSPCDLALTEPYSTHREIVHLKNPFSQAADSEIIPSQIAQASSIYFNSVEVMSAHFKWSTNSPALKYSSTPTMHLPGPKQQATIHAITTPANQLVLQIQPGPKDPPDAFIRNYLIDLYQDTDLTEMQIEMLVQTSKRMPQEMALIRKAYESSLSTVDLVLRVKGSERYFWFSPEGTDVLVPARVLDIHPVRNGVKVMVEWIKPTLDETIRHRYISMLSVNELKSIVTEGVRTRLEAEHAFHSTLSPIELKTKKIAEALNLTTWGYMDLNRFKFTMDPMTKMRNLSHHYSRSFAQKYFGDQLNSLLTDEEKREANWNIYDVFSRLNTRYAAQVLGSHFELDSTYIWSITEDYELKLGIHGADNDNLVPQQLRPANGRQLITSGKFKFKSPTEVEVQYNPGNYAEISINTDNPYINSFVKFVFQTQAGLVVRNLVEGKAIPISLLANFSQVQPNLLNQTRLNWDPRDANSKPLTYEEWLEKTNLQADPNKHRQDDYLLWAQYVLGIDEKTGLDQAKLAARALNTKFHQAKRPYDPRAPYIAPIISEAAEVYKKIARELNPEPPMEAK